MNTNEENDIYDEDLEDTDYTDDEDLDEDELEEDDGDTDDSEDEEFDDEDEDYRDDEDGEEDEEEDDGEGNSDSDNAKELAELQKRYKALEDQARETLRKMGVRSEDVNAGLVELAAEADGVSSDEYLSNRQKESRAEQAEQMLRAAEFEKMATADLAALKQEFPELKNLKHISEIPNFKRFGECRDKGLSPKEAFSAANPDGIRDNVANATRRAALNDTKNHLKSNVPKGAKDNALSIPKSELAEWREMFPGLSEKELRALYKKTI
jgi:hypothetical protein